MQYGEFGERRQDSGEINNVCERVKALNFDEGCRSLCLNNMKMQFHAELPGSADGIEGKKAPSPDPESPNMEMYRSLGLQTPGKKVAGAPRVLSLVSSLVERSVEKSERLLEMARRKDTLTIFHGVRAPSLSLCQYIDRIYKYFGCSASCFIVAIIYVDRFLRKTEVLLTSLNVHRLLITSMTLAAKFMDDTFFNNAYYAKVGGVSTTELNRLELKFLFAIDYRLHVSLETFHGWCLMLEKESAAACEGILVHIEWPIQVQPFENMKEKVSFLTQQLGDEADKDIERLRLLDECILCATVKKLARHEEGCCSSL